MFATSYIHGGDKLTNIYAKAGPGEVVRGAGCVGHVDRHPRGQVGLPRKWAQFKRSWSFVPANTGGKICVICSRGLPRPSARGGKSSGRSAGGVRLNWEITT